VHFKPLGNSGTDSGRLDDSILGQKLGKVKHIQLFNVIKNRARRGILHLILVLPIADFLSGFVQPILFKHVNGYDRIT